MKKEQNKLKNKISINLLDVEVKMIELILDRLNEYDYRGKTKSDVIRELIKECYTDLYHVELRDNNINCNNINELFKFIEEVR